MATVRVIAPVGGGCNESFGRVYKAAEGTTLDVPDGVAQHLLSSGWTRAGNSVGSGAAARPANPRKGEEFHDTALNMNIIYDGKTWRRPDTGAAV